MKAWALVALLLLAPAGAAHALSGCSIGVGGQILFGPIVALASTGDVDSNSGDTVVVRCGTDVALPPRLHSSVPRELSGPGGTLPFRLSLLAPGGLDVPQAAPGSPLDVATDDTDHVVTLHARLRAADFAGLASGNYVGTVTLTIEY